MPQTFWSHTVWFILLGIATLMQLGFILKKASDKRHAMALFLVTSGVTFTVEVIIYCFFRVYDYYPMIFPHSPIDDGLAGNLFSQFSLSATAMVISVYNLKYRWMVVFAGIYFLIEELFLHLGIYKQNFYSTWVTSAALLSLLFPVTKAIYKRKTVYTKKTLLRYYFMFLGLYTLHMPTALWIQILTGIMKPNTELLSGDLQSYSLVSLLNLLILSVVCTFVYFSKIHLLWKILLTIALYAFLYLAKQYQIMYIKEDWFIPFATIDIFAMYLYIYIMNRLMTNPYTLVH